MTQQEINASITGLKVFSATKMKDRELLGETITDWITTHPELEIVDKIVTQSSDSEFHCLTITLFYKQRENAIPVAGGKRLTFNKPTNAPSF